MVVSSDCTLTCEVYCIALLTTIHSPFLLIGDANTPVVTAGFPRYEDSSPVKLPSAPHLQRGDGETASYAVSPLHDRKRASGSLRRAYNRPQIALSGHSCDTTKTLAMAAKFLPHNIINEEQVKKCTHLVIRYKT